MRVTDFGGFQLREQDGWDAGLNARQAEATTARTNVSPLEADEVQGVDSVGSGIGTTATLAIGASTNGWVNTGGDTDWYAITMVAGQSYTFTLNGSTLADPYLELYNSNGLLIGFDDDFGSGINSALRWTATATDTYYLNAQSFPGGGGTGSYTLIAATSSPASPLDSIDYHYTMPTTNISIWFSTPGYTNPSGDATLRSWTQPEIDAVMAALGTYTAIAPLNFSIAPSQGAATWIFSLANLPGNTLGYFAVGSQYAAFDPTVADFTAGLTPGGNSWVTIIHEAGHGLGMAHPHDNGAEDYGPDNSEVMQGVTDAFESFGTFNLNQGVFTTMTYNDGWRTSGFGGPPSNIVGGQATPMALDIALIQQRYGVNPTTGSGNSTYTLALTNSAYRSIWDVGGTDTISYAGSGNATIDLRAATLLNAVGGGGYVSFVQGVHGGWTIANGVVIENATGGSGNDTLIGNDAANVLTGGAGVDNMRGGLGDDTYNVDNFSDVVAEDADAGTDTVFSSTTYTLFANVENLTLAGSGIEVNGSGNALNNIITGDSAVNNLQGLGGNDTLLGMGGADVLNGGADSDILDGGAGADSLSGGDGDDFLYADINDTVVSGGNGTDWAYLVGAGNFTLDAGAGGIEVVLAGGGNDTINAATQTAAFYTYAGGGADTVTGGSNNDNIYGQDGNDILNGGDGADLIMGESGADQLTGGGGDDTLWVDSQDTLISGGAGYDFVYFVGTGGLNLDAGANGLEWFFLGGDVDVINAATQTVGIVVYAGAGADTITGGAGADVIFGQDGNDIIVGGALGDTLWGEGGADQITGGDGDDTLIVDALDTLISGGAGYDYVYFTGAGNFVIDAGVAGLEWLFSGAGNDTINAATQTAGIVVYAADGVDTVTGGAGVDVIFGQGGDDVLNGGGQNDTLWGEAGADQLSGGDGDDTLIADVADTVVSGGAGYDFVYVTGAGNFSINAGASGVEWIRGLDGNDTLNGASHVTAFTAYGGNGADTITGGSVGDVLFGEGGDDVITGGAGGDVLIGGGGADDFVFAAGWGSDLVTDFQNGLDQFDMTALAGSGVTSIANLTITAQGADALISWNGNSILVQNAAGQIDSSDFIFGP